MMNPFAAAQTLKTFARELGFDLAGIAPAGPSLHAEAYRDWIAAGKHGEMDYLARNLDERLALTRKFPWAQSVLSVAISYWQEPAASPHAAPGTPPAEGAPPGGQPLPLATEDSPDPATQTNLATGRIARYAWGHDYHRVFESKLKRLEARIREAFPPQKTGLPTLEIRTYCDTGPILERELAARAGLGWIGKHTLLINPRHGSWFLLAEMILNLDLRADDPMPDHCGTCRRCIDACPTGAITPYSVDARRCISYQTLENRGEVPASLHAAMQDAGFVVGCDICQEVCPFNRDGRPLPTQEPEFAPRAPAPGVGLASILRWNEQEWDILTRGRASRRAKFDMWRRNAEILQGPPLPQPDAARQHGADA
jgi:epoxyqueuosine reductase